MRCEIAAIPLGWPDLPVLSTRGHSAESQQRSAWTKGEATSRGRRHRPRTPVHITACRALQLRRRARRPTRPARVHQANQPDEESGGRANGEHADAAELEEIAEGICGVQAQWRRQRWAWRHPRLDGQHPRALALRARAWAAVERAGLHRRRVFKLSPAPTSAGAQHHQVGVAADRRCESTRGAEHHTREHLAHPQPGDVHLA